MPKKTKKFKVYDEILADVLKEIEPATMTQLEKALNMTSPPLSIVRSALRNGWIERNTKASPNTYTVKERDVNYD